MSNEVVVTIAVEYPGSTIAKTVRARGNEIDAVLVNRALELATKKIQAMVQAGQAVT